MCSGLLSLSQSWFWIERNGENIKFKKPTDIWLDGKCKLKTYNVAHLNAVGTNMSRTLYMSLNHTHAAVSLQQKLFYFGSFVCVCVCLFISV